MREVSCTTVAAKNLQDLGATLKDVEMINGVVDELAAGRKKGFLVPLQSPFLGPKRKLFQYQAGRFKLNYTLTKTEIRLVSVMA